MNDGIEIVEVWQGTPEWTEAKLGIPSASNFSAIMASGRDGGSSKMRDEYLRKLAGEIVTHIEREGYRGGAMDRGNLMEPELRSLFAMLSGLKPRPVSNDPDLEFEPGQSGYGFVRRKLKCGIVGASPDSFIGDDAVLEIKSAAPHVLIEIMKADRPPPEHIAQCQGALLVTGRQLCHLAIGYTGMPMCRFRLRRDPSYIARLEVAIETFYQELDEMVKFVRGYGMRK